MWLVMSKTCPASMASCGLVSSGTTSLLSAGWSVVGAWDSGCSSSVDVETPRPTVVTWKDGIQGDLGLSISGSTVFSKSPSEDRESSTDYVDTNFSS